jgi:hypothetical protein
LSFYSNSLNITEKKYCNVGYCVLILVSEIKKKDVVKVQKMLFPEGKRRAS